MTRFRGPPEGSKSPRNRIIRTHVSTRLPANVYLHSLIQSYTQNDSEMSKRFENSHMTKTDRFPPKTATTCCLCSLSHEDVRNDKLFEAFGEHFGLGQPDRDGLDRKVPFVYGDMLFLVKAWGVGAGHG